MEWKLHLMTNFKNKFVYFIIMLVFDLCLHTYQKSVYLFLPFRTEPINGDNTVAFGDLYGPFKLRENQVFVFAQQVKYDPEIYFGDFVVATKIYRGNNLLVENNFPITLN